MKLIIETYADLRVVKNIILAYFVNVKKRYFTFILFINFFLVEILS